ncbi:ParA family protein [Rhizosphaericola mali]|uniref:ParA family protein n=1 Tax=Rhizosphaericola mali TaxID=2545455 RepID=A0A5P2G5E7_9BACT|nr:ParA family protein [Rhizosphaericola mali]QES91054.1 ParA family protein [Rhizosphaericola mali]
MPKIITLAHQKGGVGKSTIVLNLANCFKDNVRVAVVDIDPQGTALQLKDRIDNVEIIPYDKKLKLLPYDVVFVDTPPYLSDLLPEVFSVSDLVIIPTKAGIADLLAIRSTIALVKKAQEKNKALKAGVLFNMVKYGTTLTDEVAEQVQGFNVPILKAKISDRVNFTRSVALKDGIYGIGDSKAEKEIDQLAKEILLLINT